MRTVFLALARCAAAFAILATQAGAQHQHGTGTLHIAFSGAEYALSLVSPGFDVVGFEHAAANDDDRTSVAVAISDLSKPLELFLVPDQAGCFTMSANVTLVADSAAGDAVSTTQQSAPDASGHSEFQAEYVIQCQDIGALDTIEFAYFDRFERAEKLDIRVERAGDEQRFEVTREQRLLDLSALR